MLNNLTPDQREAVGNGAKMCTVWGTVAASPAAGAASPVGGFWASIGVASWSDFSYLVASILSILFICEFLWRHVFRPLVERLGWLQPKGKKDAPDAA